ncbi:MAG: hypothetical protein J0I42_18155 [Bosea sp.]|uniref:hypothetical protein n=1 Tax=Bosea sp. (in: a-proteobacteria) TaxID=1871050 RepID=UPI001ACA52C2|nr:hypothetical protein [Bosea sp. (in: a-proteobacteria)]MBN9453866.1 hypothetical protein [Bosea sp. (in: a-proteobacteria)]
MLNATVRAAATGLPAAIFDRRRMLLGLAAASTAAAAPVAVAASAPVENADLLHLGAETSALATAYREAEAARAAIVAEWGPKWPSVPEQIRTRIENAEVAYDLEGLWPDEFVKYHTADQLRQRAADYRIPRQFRKGTSAGFIAKNATWMEKRAQEMEANAALSEMYCAERDRVREASGIMAARAKERDARLTFVSHVASVMEIEPNTMAGVIVQSEALEAFSAVPPLQRSGDFSLKALKDLPAWGERLAASILRIASNAA